MIQYSLGLPFGCLKISFNKRRGFHAKKYFQEKIAKFQDIRKGSKVSRLGKEIFQYKKIKTVLGANLVLLAFSASFISSPVSALDYLSQKEIISLSSGPVEAKTEKTEVRLPVKEFHLTQGFSFFHQGVDLDGQTGDPIYPIMKGKIESIINERFGLGKHIIINHGSGLRSVYGHLSQIEVKIGEEVDTEKEIGKMGNTGHSFGDHLHLEIIDNGRHINPLTVLPVK